MLATSDRQAFVGRLHGAKRKQLQDMVSKAEIPLRQGKQTPWTLPCPKASGA